MAFIEINYLTVTCDCSCLVVHFTSDVGALDIRGTVILCCTKCVAIGDRSLLENATSKCTFDHTYE